MNATIAFDDPDNGGLDIARGAGMALLPPRTEARAREALATAVAPLFVDAPLAPTTRETDAVDAARLNNQTLARAPESGVEADPKPARPRAPASGGVPTQSAPAGIRFDFNDGCRLRLPRGQWRVCLSDLDTDTILYRKTIGAGTVLSAKHHFVRFRLTVEGSSGETFAHNYDCVNQDVLIRFDVGSLGDTIGWFAQAAEFQRLRGCRLTCAMAANLIPLFRDAYPHIAFVDRDAVLDKPFYATYRPILYFNDTKHLHQPTDYQIAGLHRNAAEILGIPPVETPPRLALDSCPRPYAPPPTEPYVCIAAQATSQNKYWNNPHGWREIVRFIEDAGYRVVCIDQKPVHGKGLVWNHIPHGAEDMTGDRPLLERAIWLRGAAFFVGLSSGLSWLAWAAGTPVVMIGGFTHPRNEFRTPYRVVNFHACNSCFNDVRIAFKPDYMWCPRHAGTARQFECSRLITAAQVRQAIERIPGFSDHAAARRQS